MCCLIIGKSRILKWNKTASPSFGWQEDQNNIFQHSTRISSYGRTIYTWGCRSQHCYLLFRVLVLCPSSLCGRILGCSEWGLAVLFSSFRSFVPLLSFPRKFLALTASVVFYKTLQQDLLEMKCVDGLRLLQAGQPYWAIFDRVCRFVHYLML